MIRNLRYPELGGNFTNRCVTCGSDTINGVCPRDCNEYGPQLSVLLFPMDPVLAPMSQELGATKWFQNRDEMYRSLGEFLPRMEGPALIHLVNVLVQHHISL